MGRSIKLFPNLEHVSEPYRMMFRRLKKYNKQPQSQYFCKENENTKNVITLFHEGVKVRSITGHQGPRGGVEV
jgi:predicted transposase YdaD